MGIRAVAGTDTFFGKAKNEKIRMFYKQRIVNWVSSTEPTGTILSESVPKRVSAGHRAHEYTSASAFKHIFNYFDSMLKMNKMMNVEDKSLANANKNEEKKQDADQDKENECAENEKTSEIVKDNAADALKEDMDKMQVAPEQNDKANQEETNKDEPANSDKMELD